MLPFHLKILHRLTAPPFGPKAIVCSIGCHAAVGVVISVWGASQIERFTSPGKPQSLQMQIVSAEPEPEPTPEVTVEPAIEPVETDVKNPIDSPRVPVASLALNEVEIQRTQRLPVVQVEQQRRDIVSDSIETFEVASIQQSNQDVQPPEPIHPQEKASRREVHHNVTATVPFTVDVTSIPGLDEKIPPDFAGNAAPQYPPEGIRLGYEGTVLVRFSVSATGSVDQVEVVESSGYELLDQAAVEAIQSWQGRPATRGGVAIETVEVLPVRFRLNQ